MEFTLSGKRLKKFARTLARLALKGGEFVFQVSPSELVFHTPDSPWCESPAFTFKRKFFEDYTVSYQQVQVCVWLKDVRFILNAAPVHVIEHLTVKWSRLHPSGLSWTLKCNNGKRFPCSMKLKQVTTISEEGSKNHLRTWMVADDNDDRNLPDSAEIEAMCAFVDAPFWG